MLLGGADPGRTDVPAVRVGEEALDRAALWEAASAFAARVAGAPAVAVHGQACLSTVVAVVGGVLAGVPVVPVPADAGTGERRHILADSKAALWAGPPLEGVAVPRVPAHPFDRAPAGVRLPEPGPDETALIMYTSGTTGPPKGVLLPRRAVAAGLDGLAEAWGWTGDDVLVHGLPLFHVHGLVLGLFGALRTGSPLVHTVRPRPQAYAAAAQAGGTLFFGVPTVWSRIARESGAARALGSARLLVSGSAGLPAGVAQAVQAAAGQAPIERYGMTETLITLAARAGGGGGGSRSGPAGSAARSPGCRRGCAARTAARSRPTAAASAHWRCAARRCSTATWACPRPRRRRGPRTGGSRPGTRRRWTRTAGTGSWGAPRWT
uniref:AMP-binding protein n=1 Tax=Nocardiopsis halophila TaxID=141692 RepID=UPI00373AE5DC